MPKQIVSAVLRIKLGFILLILLHFSVIHLTVPCSFGPEEESTAWSVLVRACLMASMMASGVGLG